MKYFALALVSVFLLSSCGTDWTDSNTKQVNNLEIQQQDNLFKKKQECAKYIPQVEDEFKNRQSSYTSSHKLYELFYSQKLNTCLKAYTLVGWLTQKVNVYAIDDVLSKDNIWQKSTWNLTDFQLFVEEIKKLK